MSFYENITRNIVILRLVLHHSLTIANMKTLAICLLVLLSAEVLPQEAKPVVEFVGTKVPIVQASRNLIFATGKLSSGEPVKTGCEHGNCYFRIEYKGRTVDQVVGEDITKLSAWEYDFGADGDKEIVVLNTFGQSAYIMIYTYSRGIIQKMFEKDIQSSKVIVKKDFIEMYKPEGLDQLWYYFKGQFWEMKPLDISKFKYK